MDRSQFDALVGEALETIPEPFLRRLENVEVIIEDEPAPALLRRMGLNPKRDTLFGLYEGTPLSERAHTETLLLPDRIILFYGPLVRSRSTLARLRREIRDTVIHEIAHFFGMDDDEIAREGY